jgi:SAM-dependent methyltransferase
MKARHSLMAAALAAGVALAAFAGPARAQVAQPAQSPARTPDVVFVPTPQPVVDEMLKVASVGPNDVLYDLGSGDGRIPITAAQRFGTRGLGVDIDPQRIKEAIENAEKAKVTDKVRFVQGDLFEMDLSEATVITLYLLPDLNLKLRPKLLKLKPGTRIVSHDFSMGDWKPEKVLQVAGKTVYYWTVPPAGQPMPKQ